MLATVGSHNPTRATERNAVERTGGLSEPAQIRRGGGAERLEADEGAKRTTCRKERQRPVSPGVNGVKGGASTMTEPNAVR